MNLDDPTDLMGPNPGDGDRSWEHQLEQAAAEARADEPAPTTCPRPRPTNGQLVELRRTHPVPWRVENPDVEPLLVDALGQEIWTATGIEQLVADAVNALVANAHHTEETR